MKRRGVPFCLFIVLLSCYFWSASSTVLAQPDRHSGCPKSSNDNREEQQWEYVLMLDNSISMKNNGIWEETKKAFINYASKIPLYSRVYFYAFNSETTQYSVTLDRPRFESLNLTEDERRTLGRIIKELQPVAKVTPLSFYYYDLLKRHNDKLLKRRHDDLFQRHESKPESSKSAAGRSYYIYTDGEDESCDPKYFPRFINYQKYRQKDLKTEECRQIKDDVENEVTRIKKEDRFFIWSVTEPREICESDEDCITGKCVQMRDDKRCVRSPRENWEVSIKKKAVEKLDAAEMTAGDRTIAEVTITKQADFPALVVTSWIEETGTKALDVEPPTLIFPLVGADGKEKDAVDIKTRVAVFNDLDRVPNKVSGRFVFKRCWGDVNGLTEIPVTFELEKNPEWLFEKVRQRGTGTIHKPRKWNENIPNLIHFGKKPLKASIRMRPDNGGNLYRGITSANLQWQNGNNIVQLDCDVRNKERDHLLVNCPIVPEELREREARVTDKGRLIFHDETRRFTFKPEARWLRTRIRIPARGSEGSSYFWFVAIAAAILTAVAIIIIRGRRYPDVRRKLFLKRSDGRTVELFSGQSSRFRKPEQKLVLSDLFERAIPGEVMLSVDRAGQITLEAPVGNVTWAGQPVVNAKAIGSIDINGNLIGSGGTLSAKDCLDYRLQSRS